MAKQTNKPTTLNATAKALSEAFKNATNDLVVAIQTNIDNNQVMSECITRMRKTKVKFGASRKTCAMLQYVFDVLGTLKSVKGTALTESTKNDYLSAIKKSVNTGEDLNLNSRRKPKPAGQSSTPAKKDKAKLTENSADKTESEKSTKEKLLIQLENAVSILQGSEDADFDVVKVLANIKSIIATLDA